MLRPIQAITADINYHQRMRHQLFAKTNKQSNFKEILELEMKMEQQRCKKDG